MFEIPTHQVEVSLTFFYLLPGRLRALRSATEQGAPFEKREWRTSELSHYIEPRLLKRLTLDHFHILVQQVHRNDWPIRAESGRPVPPGDSRRLHDFRPISAFMGSDGHRHESLAPVECSIFPNGFISLVVRMENVNPIDCRDILDLTRHPEHDGRFGLHSGDLVQKAQGYVESKLEPILFETLRRMEARLLTVKDGRWVRLEELITSLDMFRTLRLPQPHVGIVFSMKDGEGAPLMPTPSRDAILRFVIGAFRTTPAFFEAFEPDPMQYLRENLRDVYGAGESVVAVGSRGFCAYDAEPRTRRAAFRFGVIETGHYIVNAVRGGAETRVRYVHDIDSEAKTLDDLEGLLVKIAEKGWATPRQWWRLRGRKAAAVTLLARARRAFPDDDATKMLATVGSHTGKRFYRRMNDLTSFENRVRDSERKLHDLHMSLDNAREYTRSQMLRWAFVAAIVAVVALALDVVSGFGR